MQEQFEYPDGSAFRITTQRYYTPTGRCIQKPYENGMQDDYHDDFLQRLENGELTSKDSIAFVDSLQFTTPKGKIVYGGGGIMPDVFIPMDTSSYHLALAQANRKGLIRNFAFDYTDTRRAELENQSLEDFIALFEVDHNSLLQLEMKCNEKDVALAISELSQADKKILKTQLKAFIARNIWSDAGFYPIIHQIDNTFQEAIQL